MAAPEYHRLLVCGTALSILLSTYVVFMTSVSGARGLQAWTSWADVHRRMSEVEVVRSEDMLTLDETKVEMEWWIVPMLSLFVFGLLGFGRGTRAGYHDLVDATVGRLSQTRCRGSSVLPIQ